MGPRQTSAVSSTVCWDASLRQLHPRPRHTLLHHASFQATSAAQMMLTARHLEPGISHNCMASRPKHHPQFSLFLKDLNNFLTFLPLTLMFIIVKLLDNISPLGPFGRLCGTWPKQW